MIKAVVGYFKELLRAFYESRYQIVILVIIGLVISAFFYRLNTLTPGPHTEEILYYAKTSNLSFSNFLSDVVFLPHQILSNIVSGFQGPSLLILRLSSIIFAASIVPMLFYVLYVWHSRRIAVFGVVILLSSAWFVSVARFGTANIMYAWGVMSALTAMTIVFHHRRHDRRRKRLLAFAGVLFGLSLYVPYVVFLYLLAAAIAYSYLKRLVKELRRKELYFFLGGFVITTLPLIASFIVNHENGITLLGLPLDNWPESVRGYFENVKDMFSHIFWRSDNSLPTNVDNLPLLGIFGATMAALGIYHYEQHHENIRTHLLVGLFFGLFLLLAIDFDPQKTTLLLPIVYILVAMGVVTLLSQWYRIFPKNPLARSIGLGVLALFIASSLLYNNQRYFSAWAKAPQTKVNFSNDVSLVTSTLDKFVDERSTQTVAIVENQERLIIWLDRSFDQSIRFLSADQITKLDIVDILIIDTDLKQKFSFDLSNYEFEQSIDTTSEIDPTIYELYTKK